MVQALKELICEEIRGCDDPDFLDLVYKLLLTL